MDEYTIYCTTEQTKKALELGAPLETEFECHCIANQEHGYYIGCTFQELVECMGENTTVLGNEPNRIACITPTTEQMIGWLEEKGITVKIVKCDIRWFARPCSCKNTDFNKDGYSSRKEATLAAIDSALNYLIQIKGGDNE